MPIKGLTDQGAPTFPCIGHIRKGAAKPEQGNRPGKDLDYFRAVFDEGEEEAAARFTEVYGAEPREINVILPFDQTARNFDAWQEEHTAGALQHRCDGVTCVIWRDKGGDIHHEPKPCPGGCSPVGRLKVIVPELRRLAYLVVHTTSKWDIATLQANLDALRRMTGNGVKGIPLVLKRRPREISTPSSNGRRVRRKKWMLTIEADPRWVERQLQAMELAALPGVDGYAELPAGGDDILTVDPDTGEVLDTNPAIEEAEAELDEYLGGDDEGLDAEDAEESGEPDQAPELRLPDTLAEYAEAAIERLRYKNVGHVYNTLMGAGVKPLEKDGKLNFDPLEGWDILQRAI